MKKLIGVINRKLIHQRKSSSEIDINYQKRFLSFMFRKQKLSKKITLKSFENHQHFSKNSLLAITNFDGTQFVIKTQTHQSQTIRQEQEQDNIENTNKNQHSIQKLHETTSIPEEVYERFQTSIKEGSFYIYLRVNQIMRKLYSHKKNLLSQTPFEWNINLTLWILVVFVFGLVLFTLNNSAQRQNQESSVKQDKFSAFFYVFLSLIITIGLINFIYAFCKPYNYFNFDYQVDFLLNKVIQSVSKKLMEQNQSFFHQRKYTLLCGIEMTWILLKPKDHTLRRIEN